MKYIENATQTPIFTTLQEHIERKPLSGHVPGHKYGSVFPEMGKSFFQELLKLDATEITGLDDLHDPQGMIEEAQRLTAKMYGSDQTYFLVNGSTVGNLAMILATCERGSKVLVQRNCHKSVLNGIELAGAEPIFLLPEYDQRVGVSTSVTDEVLKEAINKYSKISAVIVTNPNYYGLSISLSSLIKTAHSNNIPVLVDEAHGAHFILGEPFPKTALSYGADVVIQSAHKTLPAMTMGSYLHLQGTLVKSDRIQYYLRMLQSSSPSYPIMASLDLAKAYLATFMQEKKKELFIQNVLDLKIELRKIKEITVIEAEPKVKMDPLKLILRSTEGLSGFELQSKLEEQGIFPEFADLQNVLFILPLSTDEPFHVMINRIRKAVSNRYRWRTNDTSIQNQFKVRSIKRVSPLAIPLHQQNNLLAYECDLLESVGKVSAETIIPYPPGIPVIYKGELITEDTVQYLVSLIKQGAKFQGKDIQQYRKIHAFDIEKE